MGSVDPIVFSGPATGGPYMQKSSTPFKVNRRDMDVWLTCEPTG